MTILPISSRRGLASILVASTLLVAPGLSFGTSGLQLKENADAYERMQNPNISFSADPGAYAQAPLFIGYVNGVTDTATGHTLCFSHGVTGAQIYSIVSKYLRDHPQEWNQQADELVIRALRTTFSCAKK
jgi:Ssp1 endopeptidase immunity protein Rap1a